MGAADARGTLVAFAHGDVREILVVREGKRARMVIFEDDAAPLIQATLSLGEVDALVRALTKREAA